MENEFKKVTSEELDEVSGGRDGIHGMYAGPIKTVHGLESGWLALRSEPCYDASNEIGKLYNGDKVQVIGNDALTDHDFDGPGMTSYTWVYSKKLNKSGWVNSRFI